MRRLGYLALGAYMLLLVAAIAFELLSVAWSYGL